MSKKSKQPLLQNPGVVGVLASLLSIVIGLVLGFILLVVLNPASIQLLPPTVASIRSAYGSAAPFDILPAVWVSSLASVTVGLLTARFLSRRKRGHL